MTATAARRLVIAGTLPFLCATSAGDDLYGPVLGIIAGAEATALRPIRGIPGAAGIGQPLDLGSGVHRVAVAPRRSAALVYTDSGVRVAALQPDGGITVTDTGLPPEFQPLFAGFSPSGAAALFDGFDLWLMAPAPRRIDFARLPGAPGTLAPGDSPAAPLAGTLRDDDGSVFVLDGDGGYRLIGGFGSVTDLTFLGSTGVLAVADAGAKRVLLVRDPLSYDAPEPVIELPGAPDVPFRIASSADGRFLAVLASGGQPARSDANPVLGLLRLSDGRWFPVDCDCAPAALAPLNGNAVFRLTGRIDQPLWILDGDADPPRAVFIPAVSQ